MEVKESRVKERSEDILLIVLKTVKGTVSQKTQTLEKANRVSANNSGKNIALLTPLF